MGSGKAVQGFIQSGGGNPQGQRLHNLPGAPSHCLTVLGVKSFPLYPVRAFLVSICVLSFCSAPVCKAWLNPHAYLLFAGTGKLL